MSETDGREIGEAFSLNGVEIAVLGCYIEPSLPDANARREQLSVFESALGIARAAGAKWVGTETTRFDGEECDREGRYRILLDSVLRMTEAAEREGVGVLVEPVRAHTLNSPELTSRLLSDVGSPNLAVIFDAVNMLLPSEVGNQESVWRECFSAFGDSIRACHVKDAIPDSSGFCPCPLGHGVIEYGVIAEELARRGSSAPLIREETRPEWAVNDRAFLARLALLCSSG